MKTSDTVKPKLKTYKISDRCNAAVFEKVGEDIKLMNFSLPERIERKAALVKVRFSTICGSDLHTISGRRTEPTPLILGHEIVGEIVETGDDLVYDGYGEKLNIGDRISWTIMASCGECFFCRNNLPQKCVKLKKYGHTSIEDQDVKSPLLGGYGEYVYILPGTTVFKVPENLSDEIAAPANCALSTVMNAVETISIRKGDIVLIQGGGLLGLNACALASEAGADEIILTDILDSRLETAKKFGATKTLNIKDVDLKEFAMLIDVVTGKRGADVCIEVCGAKTAPQQAVEALRTGGRYLIAGLVTPGSILDIDANQVTRKCLTIKGIHNYRPDHLGMSLKFLEKNYRKYPFEEIVKLSYPLDEINQAVKTASTGEYIRVGIKL